MKLPSLSNSTAMTTTTTAASSTMSLARSSSWPWPAYCHQPKTLSFRGSDDVFRTIYSAYLDSSPPEPPDVHEGDLEDYDDSSSIETVIRGARSEGRLFFEPVGHTSSVLAAESSESEIAEAEEEEEEEEDGVATMCVVESRDPYGDFRKSMEEMVEAHALSGDWDSLEDLLRCYLRVNDRANHAYIFRAFVDLLLSGVPPAPSCSLSNGDGGGVNNDDNNNNSNSPSTSSSPCSPLSFYTSSSSYCSSSSDSLSTTPCCASVTGESSEDNYDGAGRTQKPHRPPPSKLEDGDAEPNKGCDDGSYSTSSSSCDI